MRILGRLGAIAAFLVGGCLPEAALVARWLEVGAATNGVKVLVDADSLVTGEGGVRLTQRFVFPRIGPSALSRVDQQVVYGCADRTVRTLRSVEYNRAGRVSRVDKADATPPYRVSPGTLPQYVFDLVC